MTTLTNEVRRELASRLRSPFDVVKEGRYHHLNGTLFGMGLYANTEIELRIGVSHLADLIEPEPERTCRYVEVTRGGETVWVCSECGGLEPPCDGPKYCIDCGAKVVG